MTYKELKEFLSTMTEEQLNQHAAFATDDEDESAREIDGWEISDEDVYWEHHGDCVGNLKEVKDAYGDEWENQMEDLIMIPKGRVLLTV